MEYINKNSITVDALCGRGLIRAVGKNSCFDSDKMTVGYALYKKEYGIMEPHAHAEETVIITKSVNGYVSWGSDAHHLQRTIALEEGMILHIPENEWHAFHYDEGGCVENVFIYGQGDNCRPEDNER